MNNTKRLVHFAWIGFSILLFIIGLVLGNLGVQIAAGIGIVAKVLVYELERWA